MEVEALKSDEPGFSYAVKWARQAVDGLSGSPLEAGEGKGGRGRELREFAVDVAAKRVRYLHTRWECLGMLTWCRFMMWG